MKSFGVRISLKAMHLAHTATNVGDNWWQPTRQYGTITVTAGTSNIQQDQIFSYSLFVPMALIYSSLDSGSILQ